MNKITFETIDKMSQKIHEIFDRGDKISYYTLSDSKKAEFRIKAVKIIQAGFPDVPSDSWEHPPIECPACGDNAFHVRDGVFCSSFSCSWQCGLDDFELDPPANPIQHGWGIRDNGTIDVNDRLEIPSGDFGKYGALIYGAFNPNALALLIEEFKRANEGLTPDQIMLNPQTLFELKMNADDELKKYAHFTVIVKEGPVLGEVWLHHKDTESKEFRRCGKALIERMPEL